MLTRKDFLKGGAALAAVAQTHVAPGETGSAADKTALATPNVKFKDLQTVASTTFSKGLDTNRSVASEDPMLYYEIQHVNTHRDEMWELFSQAVKDLREASVSDDPERFRQMMEAGRQYFDS